MRGVYILIIRISKATDIEVGAKGRTRFRKGLYAYVGSAQNNLEKRIIRHLQKHKKKFWHIDYLLNDINSKIAKVFLKKANKKEECAIAEEMGEEFESVRGFGCSDCKCLSHLFYIKNLKHLQNAARIFFRRSKFESISNV